MWAGKLKTGDKVFICKVKKMAPSRVKANEGKIGTVDTVRRGGANVSFDEAGTGSFYFNDEFVPEYLIRTRAGKAWAKTK
jgi:hypothetical protein